jgi:hypothetical protein
MVLQGVTFVDYYAYKVADGTAFTSTINYWIELEFADKSTRNLSSVGLLFDEGVEISFAQGDDGILAGVMMLKFNEAGSMMRTVYALAAIEV